MYSIEDVGLIKIDLLSQRSLGVLKETMKMLNGSAVNENVSANVFKLVPRH